MMKVHYREEAEVPVEATMALGEALLNEPWEERARLALLLYTLVPRMPTEAFVLEDYLEAHPEVPYLDEQQSQGRKVLLES